jgi:hypothetical protein
MGPRARETHRRLDREYAESEARDGVDVGDCDIKTTVLPGITRPAVGGRTRP